MNEYVNILIMHYKTISHGLLLSVLSVPPSLRLEGDVEVDEAVDGELLDVLEPEHRRHVGNHLEEFLFLLDGPDPNTVRAH